MLHSVSNVLFIFSDEEEQVQTVNLRKLTSGEAFKISKTMDYSGFTVIKTNAKGVFTMKFSKPPTISSMLDRKAANKVSDLSDVVVT